MPSPDGKVTGVRFETGDGATEMQATDIVVDASGRSALTAALLRTLGRPLPEETSVGIDLGYSSCIFEPAATDDQLEGGVHVSRRAHRFARRHAVPDRRESLDRDPRRPARCDDAGKSGEPARLRPALRTSTIYDVISKARCLTDVYRYNFPQSTLRHFDRLEGFPQGLLPIGDLICRFNPTWGQGMSVASQEACVLRRQLSA